MIRFSQWVLVLMLVCSLGTCWIFLQSIAWAGMVVSYSQNASLTEAVKKTFDGQHPCKLCKFVKAGKAAEKKQGEREPVKKIELIILGEQLAIYGPVYESITTSTYVSTHGISKSPPTPPPERA